MKKRLTIMIFLSFILTALVFAGDKAEFVNLGFSPDGRYFLFGQYGFRSEQSLSYADIYLVDVKNNIFVSGGVLKGEYTNSLEPGQSADGALYKLMESALTLKNRYGIDFLEKGRPLYIRIDESEESLDSLDFRDFETGSHYGMTLYKNVISDEDSIPVKSSFYVDLDYTGVSGSTVSFKIGHPDYMRSGIGDYRIERVLTDPLGDSIVIILAKTDRDLNVRYMVETLKIH